VAVIAVDAERVNPAHRVWVGTIRGVDGCPGVMAGGTVTGGSREINHISRSVIRLGHIGFQGKIAVITVKDIAGERALVAVHIRAVVHGQVAQVGGGPAVGVIVQPDLCHPCLAGVTRVLTRGCDPLISRVVPRLQRSHGNGQPAGRRGHLLHLGTVITFRPGTDGNHFSNRWHRKEKISPVIREGAVLRCLDPHGSPGNGLPI